MIAAAAIALWLAAGQPPPPAVHATPGKGRLAMQIAADAAVVAAIEARLGPRLAAQGVELAVEPAPYVDVERALATAPDDRAEAPLARAWLDGRELDTALLLLIPRRADRVLARRIRLADRFDEAALAEIGFIVDRAVASLLASEPIGLPPAAARAEVLAVRPRATAPAATSVARPPAGSTAAEPPARLVVQLGALAGVAAWSAQSTSLMQAGLLAGAEREIARARVGITTIAMLWLPTHVGASGQGVRVSGGDVHLLINFGWRFGGWGVGRVGVGPGLIVTRVEPDVAAAPGQAVAALPRTDRDLTFALSVRWDVPIARSFAVFATATLDALPVHGAYTVSVNGMPASLFEPWPFRPAFAFGLVFGDAGR